MILAKYRLVNFNEPLQGIGLHTIKVPAENTFICVKVLHDGIYMYYEVPSIVLNDKNTILHKYMILKEGQSIPKGATFVDVADTIALIPPEKEGGEPQEGLILFPIYKLK